MSVLDKVMVGVVQYLDTKGFEYIERIGNYVTFLDDGVRVFAFVRTVKDEFLPVDEAKSHRSEFENVAIAYYMERGVDVSHTTRFDDIQMVVLDHDHGYVRHILNCME